mgnify:CR=1 FL=1
MNESFKSLDKVKPKMEVIFYDYSDNPWLDTDKNNEVSKYTTWEEVNSFNKKEYKPTVYEFNTILDEALFIFNKIIDLVNSGVSLNKIYIVNNEEYRYIFKRLSRNYKVSVNFNSNENILSSNIVRDFLNECYYKDTFKEALEQLNDNDPLYSNIVNVINNYGLKDIKPLACIELLKNVFKEIKELLKNDINLPSLILLLKFPTN